MDVEGKRFGRGHKELGGARDLISQYRLWPYYEFFCKKSLPSSISDTPYLRNVVGDTKIRKGEGMELDQLCRKNTADSSEKKTSLAPFELDVLSEAFHMREMDPLRLSSKGLAATKPKLENQSRGNKRKNKKDKSVDRKNEKHNKHKLGQVKDGSCIENNRISQQQQQQQQHGSHPFQLKNQQDNKKRRAEASNDPSVSKRSNTRQ